MAVSIIVWMTVCLVVAVGLVVLVVLVLRRKPNVSSSSGALSNTTVNGNSTLPGMTTGVKINVTQQNGFFRYRKLHEGLREAILPQGNYDGPSFARMLKGVLDGHEGSWTITWDPLVASLTITCHTFRWQPTGEGEATIHRAIGLSTQQSDDNWLFTHKGRSLANTDFLEHNDDV